MKRNSKQSMIPVFFLATILLTSAAPCSLMDGGQPLPVVISAVADDSVRESAETLADILGKMSDCTVPVVTGNGIRGLAVGYADDFPELRNMFTVNFPPRWTGQGDLSEAQRYVLKSHPEGIAVIGATQLAVEYAVWDLLHRLGYRHFFPADHWEIIPRLTADQQRIAVEADERPDYFDRRIWYGFGGDVARKRAWNFRNRMSHHGWRDDFRGSMDARWKTTLINAHHAYGSIISLNKAAFDANPDLLALVNGERRGSKLCISNPDLAPLALNYARDWFRRFPHSFSVSMEPSDGYGWCECEPCVALGTPSTRMIHLANQVAEGLETTHPDKRIGVLAYARHAEPPAISPHPRIAVQCATHLSGNIPFEERLTGWSEISSVVGFYAYYAVAQWHHAMPGRMIGGNLEHLAETIPAYHALGARMMCAEAGDCWGPNGLGYVVAARLLWDVGVDVNAVVDDFLDKSFGSATDIMRRYYTLMDSSRNAETAGELRPGSLEYFEDRYRRMYAIILAARDRAGSDAPVLARLHDVLLYTRQVQLWCALRRTLATDSGATATARDEALERYIRFAWQIRETGMGHWAGVRGVTANAGGIDLNSPPSWLSADESAAFAVADWDRVTPVLIEATLAEAERAAAGTEIHEW